MTFARHYSVVDLVWFAVRPLLFRLDPETAHVGALRVLAVAGGCLALPVACLIRVPVPDQWVDVLRPRAVR